jgi:Uma2 family endonuclease
MATPTTHSGPRFKADAAFRTFTGAEYDRMVEHAVLTKADKVELLEGYLVLKMPTNPPHDNAVSVLTELFVRMIPPGWIVRGQSTAKLSESRPEPDVALARGDRRTFANRHPTPADFGLVVEVSDSSLARDEQDKTRIYARDAIPVYWVVNLVDRRVEVFTDPTGPTPPADAPGGPDPHYRTRRDYSAGTAVPVVLGGALIGTIPVDELLP